MPLAASKNNAKPNWLEQERDCTYWSTEVQERLGPGPQQKQPECDPLSLSLSSVSSGLTSFPSRLCPRGPTMTDSNFRDYVLPNSCSGGKIKSTSLINQTEVVGLNFQCGLYVHLDQSLWPRKVRGGPD